MEPGKEPDITRGTLDGRIRPGDVTIFRLQSTADTKLRAYAAEGETLDIDPRSFGSIGVFAIPEMGRFYRHVLIEKRFPHQRRSRFSAPEDRWPRRSGCSAWRRFTSTGPPAGLTRPNPPTQMVTWLSVPNLQPALHSRSPTHHWKRAS